MASFGENLRRERELRGVDLHEMAEATKISIRFLQALEQDRVDVLPGGIFPRAFVRQYGKYLGLDPERLVAEFVFAFGGDPVPARAPSAEVHLDRSNRWWMIGAAALLVLAFLAWRTWGRVVVRRRRRRRRWPSAPPADLPAGPRLPAARAPPARRPRGVVVGLTVRKKSWVEAKVDGTTVLSRVMDEGETHRLDARDAVTLSLGNAGGVEYSLNGRPAGVPRARRRSPPQRGDHRRRGLGGLGRAAPHPRVLAASAPPVSVRRPPEDAPAAEPSPAPSPGPAV